MFKDFKDFITRGNVVDLAIAVIIGAAFTAIIVSLVDDIIMPFIGILMGGVDISSLSVTVGDATINYGNFLMALFNFLLIALILFFIIRVIASANKLREGDEQESVEEEPEPEATPEEQLLTEIRDLLQENLTSSAGPKE